MNTMLMYERVVPLHRENHRQLRMQASPRKLSSARATNALIIAAAELPLAGLEYPCVFVQQGQQLQLLALVGLRDAENLMVDEAGDWAQGAYVPAYVRRHPYVLAEIPGQKDLTLCIDEAHDGLNTERGEALFDEQGQASAYLQQVQSFLMSVHNDLQATQQFAQTLQDEGLLIERSIDCQLPSQKVTLNGFKVVDEAKLRALPAERIEHLFRSGALAWAYAHLMSLNNASKLGTRLNARLKPAA